MAEQHGHHHHHHDHHHHHHHDHHHDYAKANADHFSDHSASYVTELSTELARRCALAIVKKYPFDPARTEVLDFACGPGLISFQLLPHAKRIVGADLAPGMVAVYNKTVTEKGLSPEKLHCVEADLLKGDQTVLGDALFDVIVCTQSYHHFEDTVQVTRALGARLKPQGRLIIIDFIHNDDLEKSFGRIHTDHTHIIAHKHGFTSADIVSMFTAAGLENPQFENAFQISKKEMMNFQGWEIFGKIVDNTEDFTWTYFVACADKV